MAGGNLDFLKGMALESAQLAVNYVKGEGGDTTNSSQSSNVTAVSEVIVYQYYINITYFTCDLPVLNLT
jgi:hypothetical protein